MPNIEPAENIYQDIGMDEVKTFKPKIRKNGKYVSLGTFPTKEEAKKAYETAKKEKMIVFSGEEKEILLNLPIEERERIRVSVDTFFRIKAKIREGDPFNRDLKSTKNLLSYLDEEKEKKNKENEIIAIPTPGKKVITVKTIWQLFDEMQTKENKKIDYWRASELLGKSEEWREIPFFPDYKISTHKKVLSYKNHKEKRLVPGYDWKYSLCLNGRTYSFYADYLIVCIFADKFD